MESQRVITTKQWWVGGTITAIICTAAAFFFTRNGMPSGSPPWSLALFVFIGIESGVFIFWLAAHNAGHKGIPIR